MADLPIVSTSPVPAAVARPGANSSLREGGEHADLSLFRTVLTQELDRIPDGQAVPSPGVAAATLTRPKAGPGVAAAARTGAKNGVSVPGDAADAKVRPGDDAVRPGAAIDAPPPPGIFVLTPLPPALAALSPPAAAATAAPQSPAHAPATIERIGLAGPEKDRLAKAPAAPEAEPGLPTASAAADFAAPARFALAAAGDLRRAAAVADHASDQHPAAPAAATVIHGADAPAAPAPVHVAALDARVGERGWDQGLGDKLVWMAGQKKQLAELHLNPPELGPLKITLTLNSDQASAQFVSAHAQVREAIEAAMPRLREMLADSGITLGNASVSTDAFREPAQQQPRAHPTLPAAAAEDPGLVTREERALRLSLGLVDTFA